MRFYEYEAKALFRRHGMPLGKGEVVNSADEARRAFEALDGSAVLKSQVLSGGRMKAGAVRFADTVDAKFPMYVVRGLGGVMYLAGALIMVWNLWQTIRGRVRETMQPAMQMEAAP